MNNKLHAAKRKFGLWTKKCGSLLKNGTKVAKAAKRSYPSGPLSLVTLVLNININSFTLIQTYIFVCYFFEIALTYFLLAISIR